ncbi:FliM/FliN family flagellar motor switch protein [Aestuariibius sp. HNIBRBA575]|uniref:FliM/FliN family flagellar motor switch protein n=1 Tax=Aestuariibius sp. HNIBRBA575 TaxID=3233343 RepID=UPI0034A2B489
MASTQDRVNEESANSPTRLLRLGWERAAERAAGLLVTVTNVQVEILSLAEVISRLNADDLLICLAIRGRPSGVSAMDLQLRTAIVEMQTMGRLGNGPASERAVSAVDAALCGPVVDTFVRDVSSNADESELIGWLDLVRSKARIQDPRAASLMLESVKYRFVRIALDVGAGDRHGELTLAQALPPEVEYVGENNAPTGWQQELTGVVSTAPTQLHAVLHKMRLTLKDAESFEVGQVLPLHGCKVTDLKLTDSDGRTIARGRLGQVNGMCAIRIEDPETPEMHDVSPGGGAGLLEAGGMMAADAGPEMAMEMGAFDPDIDTGIDLPDPDMPAAMPLDIGDMDDAQSESDELPDIGGGGIALDLDFDPDAGAEDSDTGLELGDGFPMELPPLDDDD